LALSICRSMSSASPIERIVLDDAANTDVIAPPPGELFPETNDNSVAVLLTYGTARVLLAGDAEAREEYVAGDSYTGSLIVIRVQKYKIV
jgi:beta-lactamase superfamily II metal-dependent hydrolase